MDGTRDLITSNLFWTYDNFLDSIELYRSEVHTSDEELRISLKESEMAIPYYITPTSLYHGDSNLSNTESVSMHIGPTTRVTVEEISPILFLILQKMVYYGIHLLLTKKGFQVIKRRSSIYYFPNNKKYELKIHKEIGTFAAYRGFRPLLENHLDTGRLAIYFIEDTEFRVEDPIQDWQFWKGSLVGVRADFRGDIDMRGGVTLNSVDSVEEIALVTKGGDSTSIPLSGIYVLGNSTNLRKAGVFQTLNMFSRFKDNDQAMYDCLIDFVSRFSNNNCFEISFDNGETNLLQFYAEDIKEV